MIIFGTRRTIRQLMILMLTCPQGHPAAHTVSRLVTKFTLFFVPLFPIRTKYVVQCTLCGVSGRVDRDRAATLIARPAASPVSVALQRVTRGSSVAGRGARVGCGVGVVPGRASGAG